MKRLIACCALSLLFPLAAHAYEGYVVADVNLRAGPDVDYPPITLLPAGAPVLIEGCIEGWTWCDVIAGPDRGWIAGTYLEEAYGGNRVIVTDYGASIGIPVVAFSLGAYWGHYYRGRPWYHDRVRWEHHHWGYRSPPRPAGYHAGWNGGHARAGHDWRAAANTSTHRSYSGYRNAGSRTGYSSVQHRTAATAGVTRRAPPNTGRAYTQQRGHAYAQQHAQQRATRTANVQPRAEARVGASPVRTQQARAPAAGHGRAVHQSNARQSSARKSNAGHGHDRDHDRDHH